MMVVSFIHLSTYFYVDLDLIFEGSIVQIFSVNNYQCTAYKPNQCHLSQKHNSRNLENIQRSLMAILLLLLLLFISFDSLFHYS